MFISHRINTIEELKDTPIKYGIEIDIRDSKNDLILVHDPFSTGEKLDDFLSLYKHSFIILNIKSERIEYRVMKLLEKYSIKDYFFLDSSFPMIYKLSLEGESNIAIRFSEFESIESVLIMKDKVKWVWVDCFTKLPLNVSNYKLLKDNNFNICIVSPELQSQQDKIYEYKEYMIINGIIPDMICTKIYNIEKWVGIFN